MITISEMKGFGEVPLGPEAVGELRKLVGEVLAEVLPGRRGAEGSAPRPAVRPASALTAGGIPSGVPAGAPATAPARHRGSSSNPDSASTPFEGGPDGPGSGGTDRPDGGARSAADFVSVRVSTDAELHEFALRVLRLADNPKRRRDLIAGRIRFRLAGEPSVEAGPAEVPGGRSPGSAQAVHRVDKGAVTERAVAAAAAAGARLVLGPCAVMTPLARDKARALGVPMEKER